jgi:hypothetical protein
MFNRKKGLQQTDRRFLFCHVRMNKKKQVVMIVKFLKEGEGAQYHTLRGTFTFLSDFILEKQSKF